MCLTLGVATSPQDGCREDCISQKALLGEKKKKKKKKEEEEETETRKRKVVVNEEGIRVEAAVGLDRAGVIRAGGARLALARELTRSPRPCSETLYMGMGNTQSMDSLNRLEIFIPDEADATTINLCSLTAVVLKRMGFPLHDSKDSKKLAIWISPAVLRRKGQKLLSNTGKDALESASSLLGRRFRHLTGPFKMPIYSSN
ncbi:unnamed protein product, partial [Pleuronectes platessa]